MDKLFYVMSFITLTFLFACNPKTGTQLTEETIEDRTLDTLEVVDTKEVVQETYELPIYQAEATRTADLLHTRLDLSFDWENQYVLGEAYIDFKPIFYTLDTLMLHAVNFDINAVNLTDKNGAPLVYRYDGKEIYIALDTPLERNQEKRIYIDYTAKPEEAESGGSAAITSEKGLYFINPTGDESIKPRQIWTQGETESNRRWFPTFDKPNERMTQEMYITVEDRFETLSNGLMLSSTVNDDGTRTDYYKMEKPHAPYLFMLAVGEYHIEKETWNGIPIEYFVEPEFSESAKEIYAHTPEMLTFFSDIVNYQYPWSKYSQVIVRDYVSGAMENTTGVIFGEFIQKHNDELLTSPNDDIVAHEMFHHWFGDLVTTESWANLTLNEGFANYGEYLWREHNDGVDHAERHRENQLSGYLQQAGYDRHALIDYEYVNEMEMFDAHSYNKGGLVLHMLRNYIGDEAFFAALNKYLVDNEYTAVEVDELRLAVEDITGRDWHWFFNQWFLSPGHAELDIDKSYDPENGILSISIEQTQDPEDNVAIFQLPMDIEIFYKDGSSEIMNIHIDKRNEQFDFRVESEPDFVLYDPQFVNLTTMNENYSKDDMKKLLKYGENFRNKSRTLKSFRGMALDSETKELVEKMLQDDYYHVRNIALSVLQYSDNKDKIRSLAQNDPAIQVRTSALGIMAKNNDEKALEYAQNMYNSGESLLEKMTALKTINQYDSEKGLELAENYKDSKSMMANAVVTDIFASSGDPKFLPFFENKILKGSGFGNFSVIANYVSMVADQPLDVKSSSVDFLTSLATDSSTDMYTVFSAVKGLSDIRNSLGEGEKQATMKTAINNTIRTVYEGLEDGQLKNMVRGFVQ